MLNRMNERRFDVDWIRVGALGLLIVYHVVVTFQPWARMIYFPRSNDSLEGIWIVMAMINVWRIPILFLISGMGVRFAMERRDWRQLLTDRTKRILLPLVFGFFFVCPVSVYVTQTFYGDVLSYVPNLGHLWFLANIYLYVLVLSPILIYLKDRPDNMLFRLSKRVLRFRGGILLAAVPLIVESLIIRPTDFPSYAATSHGFWLGIVCFFVGFTFVSTPDAFWRAVGRIRTISLSIAVVLYIVRLVVLQLQHIPPGLEAFESMNWMLAILGFASRHLNVPSEKLSRYSRAVYPVYIIHLPVQFALATVILLLPVPAPVLLLLLLGGTFSISYLIYALLLDQSNWIRPLFGMKRV